jgi:hypothetical protein
VDTRKHPTRPASKQLPLPLVKLPEKVVRVTEGEARRRKAQREPADEVGEPIRENQPINGQESRRYSSDPVFLSRFLRFRERSRGQCGHDGSN